MVVLKKEQGHVAEEEARGPVDEGDARLNMGDALITIEGGR